VRASCVKHGDIQCRNHRQRLTTNLRRNLAVKLPIIQTSFSAPLYVFDLSQFY